MLEDLEVYRDRLPKSVADIPLPETVRSLPYIRFVADAICNDPSDKEKLQRTLWRLDDMATGDICDLYNDYQARLDGTSVSS